jgi:type II secretory pathway pseudopilin PulG
VTHKLLFDMKKMAAPLKKIEAFSLVEALVTITIIGIITFLALPNVVNVRKDTEDAAAQAKAEALNIALVSYVQKFGRDSQQAQDWNALTGSSDAERNARYALLREFLSFPPNTYRDYVGDGYNINIEAVNINPSVGGGPALGIVNPAGVQAGAAGKFVATPISVNVGN